MTHFTIFRGLDYIDCGRILAFSYTDPGPYGNRTVKNDILILHTETGKRNIMQYHNNLNTIITLSTGTDRTEQTV